MAFGTNVGVGKAGVALPSKAGPQDLGSQVAVLIDLRPRGLLALHASRIRPFILLVGEGSPARCTLKGRALELMVA